MTAPLAIDLFCGLFKPKLCLCTNASVQQFMACWAKNPDHVPLSVGYNPPCPISLEIRFMRDLKNPMLAARFAGIRHIWVAALQSVDNSIRGFFLCSFTINLFFSRVSPHPEPRFFSCRLSGAFLITITLICCWWDNVKMRAASRTVSALFCAIGLLKTAEPSGMPSTPLAAPFLVRARCLEPATAIVA
ncbi:MAG: hypothetical protein Dbin4_02615 [Alphaproteobacteria bacterium]|nr:hypothetical protein [Alphaproteobacteria bacterium]